MQTANVEGTEVKIGDYVGFKSDIEQSGKIAKIYRDSFGKVVFVLTDDDGFHGDYIGGETSTTVLAIDCWV